MLLGAPAEGSEAASSTMLSTWWPTLVLACEVCTLAPSPVWGSRDRKCPLRVWPAIWPHSPRLGGAGTACFYVLIASLKCVQTQASVCPAS